MTVLILGANGLLGSNVLREAKTRGCDSRGAYHSTPPEFDTPLEKLDIQNTERVANLLEKYDPDTVINCAAMTDVDRCERHPEEAFAVNADAPGELAKLCEQSGRQFVHISTDYVFDGTMNEPYSEPEKPNPIQVYGKSKLLGEKRVRDANAGALVLRLSFVYGTHGSTGELSGFPAWVREQIWAKEPVSLFADQHVSPSRAGQVASVLFDLLDKAVSGTIHVASRSCVTPHSFGDRIRQRLNAPSHLIQQGSIDDFEQQAERPPFTCLAVDKVEEILDEPQPSLGDDLTAIKEAFAQN